MAKESRRRSAGMLLYRGAGPSLEVLIAHPGGPLWAKKDDGAWSLPKGLYEPDESPLDAARREFAEEIGTPAPDGPVLDLGDVTLASGKVVTGFAVEGDLDASTVVSNTFEMQWPPRSGRMQSFPEIDRAEWVTPDTARSKLNPAQAEFVDRLRDHLEVPGA
ncbi:NUDIX domain-containing protein [Gordonia hankookensis]|uniref:NUDIX domain-containing protein n=1 Tax=Gordonia hankookensis TaxID=589403 RepID=A0ABR7W749_9ACTN|nr:NUDIX domain-containing protein [Gordonia hankookensis]MBD1318651.1 NUDIX domain-containing protein [Gordonia hankookensis]NDZ94174.1 NUDIX domain-containing protein [Streptomyces sp. SID11726]NEB25176.1 NUDIX domain-containing protein [Streptomyces sp. SID6673]